MKNATHGLGCRILTTPDLRNAGVRLIRALRRLLRHLFCPFFQRTVSPAGLALQRPQLPPQNEGDDHGDDEQPPKHGRDDDERVRRSTRGAVRVTDVDRGGVDLNLRTAPLRLGMARVEG